jgi:HEAT repeat protein
MLGKIGAPSVDQLLLVLKRKDLSSKGRRFVALALGETRSPRVYDTLVRLLRTDPSWQVRADAAEALGTLGDRRAIGPLSEAVMKDNDSAVVKRAGKARYRLKGGAQ